MKRLCQLVCLSFSMLASSCTHEPDAYLFSYFKGNGENGLHLAYSHDGLTWIALRRDQSFLTPQVGAAKLMRDPSVVEGPDGVFHMVWTAGWWEKGIGVAHSENLLQWSEQAFVPVMAHEENAVNCWAPEIFYDDVIRKYVIYWATTIPGRFPEGEGRGDKGQNDVILNHRIYYVTTEDFKDYSETKLLYDDGFSAIDAFIIKENGEYVMFLKNETRFPEPEKNIRIATSDHVLGPYSSASEPITGDYWAEGPAAIRIKDKWHVYFDKYQLHQYGVIVSDDLQNWIEKSDSLHMPEGIRHGTAFRVAGTILANLQTNPQ